MPIEIPHVTFWEKKSATYTRRYTGSHFFIHGRKFSSMHACQQQTNDLKFNNVLFGHKLRESFEKLLLKIILGILTIRGYELTEQIW